MRLCLCDNCKIGEPWEAGQCYLCWLFHNDAAYRRFWAEWPIRTFIRALWRHVCDWCRSATKAEQNRRRLICDGCEFRDPVKERCKKCGCRVSGILLNKIRWRSEQCPINRW